MHNDPSILALGVIEGDTIAGKYRVSRILGSGGMGVVVAAHHIYLDEKVAIKLLHPHVLGCAEIVSRFTHEARASAKIKSDHVVRVFDVGTLENGAPYMVMEHLDGLDLGHWVATRGPLPLELAVNFMLQTCEALAEAHKLGIVHRDLKPANLFSVRRADNRDHIKVLDFGISKALDWSDATPALGLTKTTSILGSPLYMSPEQMRSSKTVDARTDIWSLGVILFESLTGKVPFGGESLAEVCSNVVSQAPPSLLAAGARVPPEIDRVVHKCLEKNRDNRYADVAELARALAPFAPKNVLHLVEQISSIVRGTDLRVSTTIAASPASAQSDRSSDQVLLADTLAPAPGRTGIESRPPGSRSTKILMAFALLAVAGVAGTVAMRGRQSDRAAGAAFPGEALGRRSSQPLIKTTAEVHDVTPRSPATEPNPLPPTSPALTLPHKQPGSPVQPQQSEERHAGAPIQSAGVVPPTKRPPRNAPRHAGKGSFTPGAVTRESASSSSAETTRPPDAARPLPEDVRPTSRWGGRL